jgi:hypothetical protein
MPGEEENGGGEKKGCGMWRCRLSGGCKHQAPHTMSFHVSQEWTKGMESGRRILTPHSSFLVPNSSIFLLCSSALHF